MSFRVKVGLEASCLGTGEMARWVKSLVWNHEDLSSDLQSTHTQLSTGPGMSAIPVLLWEDGRWGQGSLEVGRPANLPYRVASEKSPHTCLGLCIPAQTQEGTHMHCVRERAHAYLWTLGWTVSYMHRKWELYISINFYEQSVFFQIYFAHLPKLSKFPLKCSLTPSHSCTKGHGWLSGPLPVCSPPRPAFIPARACVNGTSVFSHDPRTTRTANTWRWTQCFSDPQ